MFGYYLELAWQNLRRSPWLSALIVLAVGVSIGSSMTVYSLLNAMSRDPIPHKSAQLFTPRLDSLGPFGREQMYEGNTLTGARRAAHDRIPGTLPWRDAMALRAARLAPRQAAMIDQVLTVADESGNVHPAISTVATDADFFDMFEVPFLAGAAWSRPDDEARARVAVISARLAHRIFPGVGMDDVLQRSIQVDGASYRVIGVLRHWAPQPRFYSSLDEMAQGPGVSGTVIARAFGSGDDLFIPFETWIAQYRSVPDMINAMNPSPSGVVSCHLLMTSRTRGGWFSDNNICSWVKLWVELPTAGEVERYRDHLQQHAAEQQRLGRLRWPPQTRLESLRESIAQQRFVPADYWTAPLVGFGFLLVCLINAMGLMLARFHGRTPDLGLRRALGASRRAILAQCLTETALLGALGGLLGIGLLLLGAGVNRAMLPGFEELTRPDTRLMVWALLIAVLGTICAGLYPAWRTSRWRGVDRRESPGRGRFGAALIAVQLALTLAIVANSLFIAWQRVADMRRPSGVAAETELFHVLTQWPSYPAGMLARYERDLAALRAMPGVVDAAQSMGMPGTMLGAGLFPLYRDRPRAEVAPTAHANNFFVDERALDTFGLKLVAGRRFKASDFGAPNQSAIVSAALARQIYPEKELEDVVGKVVWSAAPYTIVGVVEAMQGHTLGSAFEHGFMVPLRRYDFAMQAVGPYVVRTRPGELAAVMGKVEKLLLDLDPTRAVSELRSYTDLRYRDLFRGHRNLAATLLGVGVLLLLITALGIVGLTHCWVSQRCVQIGIRRALGARRADILLRFQRENLVIAGIGVTLGAALTVAGNLWLVRQFELPRIEPVAVFGGALLIVLLSQFAVFWPARRASLIPPALVTRST